MTKFEITNENVEQRFSSNMRRNNKTLNAESKGTITIEETHGTIKFERRLSNPKEAVWKAITDPKDIFRWLPDYKGAFEGYNGGAIDLVNTVSGSHVTGDILVWDLHNVFEYEWHIAPNQMFPNGEPKSVIRWSAQAGWRFKHGHTTYNDSQPPHQINSFNFSPWLACGPRSA